MRVDSESSHLPTWILILLCVTFKHFKSEKKVWHITCKKWIISPSSKFQCTHGIVNELVHNHLSWMAHAVPY
jgi:hypothetical protein